LICSGTASDADGDTPALSYSWSNSNGSTYGSTGNTLQLTPSTVSPNETVTCSITATDDQQDNTSSAASITIDNTLPTVTVSISANGSTNTGELTCSATGSDVDDFPTAPTFTYEWFNSAGSLGSSNPLQLDPTMGVDGDSIDCVVIATDLSGETVTDMVSYVITSGREWSNCNSLQVLAEADYSFTGENIFDSVGAALDIRDVDGDGLEDIIITSGLNDDGGVDAGKVYLVLGSSLGSSPVIDLSQADYSFIGENAGDGASVSSLGDVDGDGLSDILIGAPGNDDGGNSAGKAYLVLDTSLGLTNTMNLSQSDYSFIGENRNAFVGLSIVVGDINGDGLGDILVGSPGDTGGGSWRGNVGLFSACLPN
jgi:hypothetical protein